MFSLPGFSPSQNHNKQSCFCLYKFFVKPGFIHKMKVAIKSGWQESTSLIKEMNISLIS